MANGAPLKWIDIQAMMGNAARAATPSSLAFMMPSGIPDAATTGIDPRRLPFADMSPQLRDQRQRQSLAVPQNNPFSIFGAVDALRRNANTAK